MKPEDLKQLIIAKREWTEPLSAKEKAKGFKGWYAPGHLPHFDAAGIRQFITYRLADSMPASRRGEWASFLNLEDRLEKQRKIEAYIDKGYGACQLRDPRIAKLVQENFWHHDNTKYRLLAWCIMPNHVHVLIQTWEVPLGDILRNWKSYTATKANQILGLTGAFWEEDYFDHYIRDEEHFWKVVRYIENNPAKAFLVRDPLEWNWSSARYRNKQGDARLLTRGGDSPVPRKKIKMNRAKRTMA